MSSEIQLNIFKLCGDFVQKAGLNILFFPHLVHPNSLLMLIHIRYTIKITVQPPKVFYSLLFSCFLNRSIVKSKLKSPKDNQTLLLFYDTWYYISLNWDVYSKDIMLLRYDIQLSRLTTYFTKFKEISPDFYKCICFFFQYKCHSSC